MNCVEYDDVPTKEEERKQKENRKKCSLVDSTHVVEKATSKDVPLVPGIPGTRYHHDVDLSDGHTYNLY